MVIRHILRFDPLESFVLDLFALFVLDNYVDRLGHFGVFPVGSRSSCGSRRGRHFRWDNDARL